MDLLDAHDQCSQTLTEPNVHAVRLAARHLQPVLLVWRTRSPEDRSVARAVKQVRQVLATTTNLRELQVFRLAVASLQAPPSLKRVLDRASAGQERALVARTAARLRKLDRKSLIRIAAQGWSHSPASADRRALQRALAGRRSRLMERIAELRATDPKTVHRVRIALKRYRYLVDLFAAYLPATVSAQLHRLERLQRRLGQWHDEWVLSDRLLSEATQVPPALHRKCLEQATTKATWCAAEQHRLCTALHRLRMTLKRYGPLVNEPRPARSGRC